MATFKPIDPSEFNKRRGGRAGQGRGEVVAPIVQDFLDSGEPSAELDLSDQNTTHATLAGNLREYLKRHPELGVRVVTQAPDRGDDNKPVKGTGAIRLGRVDAVGEAKPRKPRGGDLFDQMEKV